MFERFTERARQVVVLAQDEARALGHNYIGTEHLLLGLLREEEGLAAHVLASSEITVEDVRAQVLIIVGEGGEIATGQIPFTPRAKKVLELALKEAQALEHNYLGTEHILLGLVRENGGVAARILADSGVDAKRIRKQIIEELSGPGRRQVPGRVRPSARGGDAARWEYDVRSLEGEHDTWAEQLTEWRRDGWELLTVVSEPNGRYAILERRN